MKIRTFFYLMLSTSLIFGLGRVFAKDSLKINPDNQQHFVDKDGDGYNDNAPDHDGDGIPNGLDPDWQKLKSAKGKGKGLQKRRFVDLDGDGINDFLQEAEGEMKDERGIMNPEQGTPLNQEGQKAKGNANQKRTGKK